jgi:zinc/manganese transport system substrate-binding protein
MPTPTSRRLTALISGTCLALLAGCGSSSDSDNDGSAPASPAAASAVPVVASS